MERRKVDLPQPDEPIRAVTLLGVALVSTATTLTSFTTTSTREFG
jgi:hypothetical protein